jgi:hypothetical protein
MSLLLLFQTSIAAPTRVITAIGQSAAQTISNAGAQSNRVNQDFDGAIFGRGRVPLGQHQAGRLHQVEIVENPRFVANVGLALDQTV